MTDLKYLILSVLNEDRVPFYQSDLMERLPQDANVNNVDFALRDLHAKGFLISSMSADLRHYQISPAGVSVFEDESERRRDRTKDRIRWIVTTAIAVAALVVSIIALVKD